MATQEKPAFTPGPWVLRKMSYGYDLTVQGVGGPGTYGGWFLELVYYDGPDDEFEANAKMIAAAPAMYAALLNVRSIIADAAMTGFNCKDGDWAKRLFASQQVTSAAVEKAGGQS